MGYEPDFIPGHTVPLPEMSHRVMQNAYGGTFIHHSKHSILFNQQRGLAYVSANNTDGASIREDAVFESRRFEFDPKIQPETLQIGNDQGYREKRGSGVKNPWDRGHLTRRKSIRWGTEEEAGQAELESDFYTNIAPQHTRLHSHAWGSVEDWILDKVENESSKRSCVFTGPVFTPDDPFHDNKLGHPPIQIPAGFWKIIAIEHQGILKSAGFLIWQRDYDHEVPLKHDPVLEQVRLTTIEVLTGLTFPTLRAVDVLYYARIVSARDHDDERVGAGPMFPGAADQLPAGHTVVQHRDDIIF